MVLERLQVDMTWCSNHMEGRRLTRERFETAAVTAPEPVKVDDIVETAGHFARIDRVIDNAGHPLSQKRIRHLHSLLKRGTGDSRRGCAVGAYQRLRNSVGGVMTTMPEPVPLAVAACRTTARQPAGRLRLCRTSMSALSAATRSRTTTGAWTGSSSCMSARARASPPSSSGRTSGRSVTTASGNGGTVRGVARS